MNGLGIKRLLRTRRTSFAPAVIIIVGVALSGLLGPGILHAFAAQDIATNEEVARRYFDELHNEGNFAVAGEIIAPDAVFHLPDGDMQGPEQLKGFMTVLLDAFSDEEFSIVDLIAEGDMVVVRLAMSGTHDSDFQGIPPSGADVVLDSIAIMHIEDGLIVEYWIQYDRLSLMQQIGAIAPPEPQASTDDVVPLSIDGVHEAHP